MSLQERFWSKVDKSQDCWLWTAHRNKCGYGKFRLNRKSLLAHRVSWYLTFGEVPDALYVCHKCDTPACVRPDHLFIGDDLDNVLDMHSKGRAALGERLPQSKLTAPLVREIKIALSTGTTTQTELGRRYGVSNVTISDIARGVSWRHI